MIYTYTGLLFSFKKGGNSDTCYTWMNFEDIILSEISQSLKCKYCIIPLTWIISSSQIKKESREVTGREWGEEIMGNFKKWIHSFSFARWREFWKLVAQPISQYMWMYLTAHWIFKNG